MNKFKTLASATALLLTTLGGLSVSTQASAVVMMVDPFDRSYDASTELSNFLFASSLLCQYVGLGGVTGMDAIPSRGPFANAAVGGPCQPSD